MTLNEPTILTAHGGNEQLSGLMMAAIGGGLPFLARDYATALARRVDGKITEEERRA